MGRILVVGTMALLLLAAACEFTRAFSSSACRYSAGCNECGTRTDLGQRLYSTVAAVPVSCAVLRQAASVGLSHRRAGVELRLPCRAPASTTAALATLRLSSVLSPGGSFTIDLPRLPLGFTVVEQLYSEVPNMRYSCFL